MERTIKGKITKWSLEIKPIGKSHYRTLHLNTDTEKWGHKIIGSFETLNEIDNSFPINSEVEFIEIQNGKYWNYKTNSLKLLSQAEINAKANLTSITPHTTITINPSIISPESRRIVRQNALTQANSFIKSIIEFEKVSSDTCIDDIEKVFFTFAEKCEEWVLRQ